MIFNRAIAWFCASACLLGGYGPALHAQMRTGTTTLKISPRSCLSPSEQAVCLEQFEVQWQSSSNALCLWREGDEQALFCVTEGRGERIVHLAISTSTRFFLRAPDDLRELASAELLVMAAPETGLRRRYRHPWSVF